MSLKVKIIIIIRFKRPESKKCSLFLVSFDSILRIPILNESYFDQIVFNILLHFSSATHNTTTLFLVKSFICFAMNILVNDMTFIHFPSFPFSSVIHLHACSLPTYVFPTKIVFAINALFKQLYCFFRLRLMRLTALHS